MSPLTRFVLGFLVVLLDLRVGGVDLLPDLVGWILVLLGLVPLLRRSGWFQLAAGAAVLELVVSVAELTQPATGLPALIDSVATTVLLFAVTSGVIAGVGSLEVRAAGDPVRWTNLVLGVVSIILVAVVDGGGTLEASTALIVILVLATLAAVVWFLVFCWQQRAQPELV
jgi:hypothetical protein